MGIIKEPKEIYLTLEARPLKKDEEKIIVDFINSEKKKRIEIRHKRKLKEKTKVN